MTGECPAPEALARAVSEGAPAAMAEHVASCDACGLEWESASELSALARALTFEAPAPERVLAVRARVVERAIAVRRRGLARAGLYAALAVAAAAVLAIGLRRPVPAPVATEAAPRYHGTVVALNGARWSLQSAAPDEIVRLESGTIHVEVTPLGPGERFRVRAGDGEVEVRGTAFDVAVEAGHMTRVAVVHGRVEVRGTGSAAAVLAAGESWRATNTESTREPTATEPNAPESNSTSPPAASTLAASSSHAAGAPLAPSRSSVPAPQLLEPVAPTTARPLSAVELPGVVDHAAALPPARTVAPPSSGAPKSPPLSPAEPPTARPAESDDAIHEEDRRERRDERRERHDARRWR